LYTQNSSLKEFQIQQSQIDGCLDRQTEKGKREKPFPLGILPVKTITQSLFSGWWLPGQGSAYANCGEFKTYEGCLNLEAHSDGKPLIKKVHYSCFRLSCPICLEKAITRASDRIMHRLTAYEELYPECGESIHVSISPPQARAQDYEAVRRKAARLARKAGITAAVMIYHPWRLNKRTGKWRFAPHFHLIGFGWVQNTGDIYRKHGWVIKNIGIRRDPFKVIRYQLSHCGVHSVRHTITYIGGLSGRRFKAPPMPAKTSTCPVCGGFMLPVLCIEEVNPFDSLPEGSYWGSPTGWIYATHRTVHK